MKLWNRVKEARARTGLSWVGLGLYYVMVYALRLRFLWSARRIGELLKLLHNKNYAIHWTLADIYRQQWEFDRECSTLLAIVPEHEQDIELLTRAAETAAYAFDTESLKWIQHRVAALHPAFHSYVTGLLEYSTNQDTYQSRFQECVALYLSSLGNGSSSGIEEDTIAAQIEACLLRGERFPEYVRVSYNIRNLAGVRVVSTSSSSAEEATHQPGIFDGCGRGCVQDIGEDAVVLISCSQGYLSVFADYYVHVFRRKNQGIVHFHVLAENVEETRRFLESLAQSYSTVRYTIDSLAGRSQTYITLARFLICQEVMQHYGRDVLISDIDFHPAFDLRTLTDEMRSGGFDLGFSDAGYRIPWGKFAAGFSYFRIGSQVTEDYLNLLHRHLTALYAQNGFFSMDQIGLLVIWEEMTADADAPKVLNLCEMVDFAGLFKVPRRLQRGKIKCKFGSGAPE